MLDQANRIMHFQSSLGEERCVVTGLSGEERINDLYSFSASILAEQDPIYPEDILGDEVTLTIRYQETERLVHGVVARFEELDPVGQNMFEYSLEIVPPLWILGLNAHTRIFTQMTTTDIVEQVINEAISDANKSMSIEKTTSTVFSPRETCLQYNETDLDFVLRLLADDGVSFYFKHESGGVKLVLTDDASGFPTLPDTYPFSEQSNSEWRQQVAAFRRTGRLATAKLTTYDYCEHNAPDTLESEYQSRAPGKLRAGAFELHTGHYFDRASESRRTMQTTDNDTRVRRWQEGMEADAEYYSAESAAPTLLPGHKMRLSDPPTCSDDDTEFLLLEVLHSASDGIDSPSSYSNRLRCASSSNSVAFRPQFLREGPRIWGVHTARVSEVRPIPDSDVHGEVKVVFPWADEAVSCWARVAQLAAGNQWGGYFIPQVGQEVLVEFIGGAPERPVVVGAVYNSVNKIVDSYTEWDSGIRTQRPDDGSAFNELLFTDEPGEEKIRTEAGKDYEYVVHNDRTGTVTNDDSLTVEQGNCSVEVQQGDYSLKVQKGDYDAAISAGKHSTKSAKKMTLESDMEIELKVGKNSVKITQMGVTIDATMINIKSNTMASVEASAMLTLKGALTKIN